MGQHFYNCSFLGSVTLTYVATLHFSVYNGVRLLAGLWNSRSSVQKLGYHSPPPLTTLLVSGLNYF
jgi:hypothetical protein